MKPIQYDGFELDHFDSASNFRQYQISLVKKFIKGKFIDFLTFNKFGKSLLCVFKKC